MTSNDEAAGAFQLPKGLGLDVEVAQMARVLEDWLDTTDAEVQPYLRWQLLSSPKYFRPVTAFSCYYALNTEAVPAYVTRATAALEMVHNVSLVIDNLLDRSRERRGRPSLHCRFGRLPAMMAAGYLYAGSVRLVSQDAYAVELLGQLLQRLGAAECKQWRLRRQPLGVEDWRRIAEEDTGSMFETAALLAERSNKLGKYGLLLGVLYHGCDDVADVRRGIALGNDGGREDIRDRILTLPAALAIRDPKVAALYRTSDAANDDALEGAFQDVLPLAEQQLNEIAELAASEARAKADRPDVLLELVEQTRLLSSS